MRQLAALLLVLNLGFLGFGLLSLEGIDEAPPEVEGSDPLLRLEEMSASDFPRRVPVSLGGAGGACFVFGPFTQSHDGQSIGRVREWLQKRDGVTRLRDGKYQELVYHWMHFPPFGTRASAQARADELAGDQFPAAIVVPHGNMKNAVSIRVYGLRSALQQDFSRLKARGLEPEVTTVHRLGESLWFDARFPEGFEFPWRRFKVAFPGIEVVDTQCRHFPDLDAPDPGEFAPSSRSATPSALPSAGARSGPFAAGGASGAAVRER